MSEPWVQHKNSSTTSLNRHGLEKTVAPGKAATPPSNIYERKGLPPIPTTSGQSKPRRPLSDQSPGGYDSRREDVLYSQQSSRLDGTLRPCISSKSHSLLESASKLSNSFSRQASGDDLKKALPLPPPQPMTKSAQKILQLTGFDASREDSKSTLSPPPPTPMSKSAQKILQLTGFNPSFDQEPASHYSVSPESSDPDDSSGSQYSQPEDEQQEHIHRRYHWAATPSYNGGERRASHLQSSFYRASERSASTSDISIAAVAAASASTTSLRVRGRPVKHNQQDTDLTRKVSADNLTKEQLIAFEKAPYAKDARIHFDGGSERDIGSRYGDEAMDRGRTHLVPWPLATKPRVNEENSKLQRHSTNAHSPTGLPYAGIPVCGRIQPPPAHRLRHKRRFGTGKHPMKSRFPFAARKDPESEEPERKIRTKISGAMRTLSEGIKPPGKQVVMLGEGPKTGCLDTPGPLGFKAFFPSQETIQKGNRHFQEAVDKAKKSLRIKTADEKRKEELKKQIVVVGITDQSPDGRVSEWL